MRRVFSYPIWSIYRWKITEYKCLVKHRCATSKILNQSIYLEIHSIGFRHQLSGQTKHLNRQGSPDYADLIPEFEKFPDTMADKFWSIYPIKSYIWIKLNWNILQTNIWGLLMISWILWIFMKCQISEWIQILHLGGVSNYFQKFLDTVG